MTEYIMYDRGNGFAADGDEVVLRSEDGSSGEIRRLISTSTIQTDRPRHGNYVYCQLSTESREWEEDEEWDDFYCVWEEDEEWD